MLPSTTGAPWGASADEWAHFARRLDLEADLLPVVSNPNARISSLSKMQGLGKTPSRYNNNGDAVGIPAWTKAQTTTTQWKGWAAHSDLGICVQTRRVRAIDIDIADPVVAKRVRETIELTVGVLPRRMRSNSGKCLLVFEMKGEFAKRVIRTPDGIIEFLANGQQFVAVGTHTSGERYEWVDGDGVIALPAEIPELVPAEFEPLWQVLSLLGVASTERAGMMPTAPRRLTDASGDPNVPWLQENGHVREFGNDGRVHITCPWSAEHTMDSGPTATTYFPAGVGGFEQGHYRCLHAHCSGRTDADFIEAFGIVRSMFEVLPDVAGGVGENGEVVAAPWPTLKRDRNDAILPTAGNLNLILSRPDMVRCKIGFDDFKDVAMIDWEHERDVSWRPMGDRDYESLRIQLENRGVKGAGTDAVRAAVGLVLAQNRFDSAIEWASTLVWDGVPRVARFMPKYMGTGDTKYSRSVGKYLWTALAGRCATPGVKVDMVVVLVGEQGTGKTSMVEALAPDANAFVEVDLGRDDEKLARAMRGKLVGEIAELRGLQGRESESIKAWITRREEEWVPKYKEFTTRFLRRLVFIGTANNAEFLDDASGERRWLPIMVGDVDVAAIVADREQLWAEGLAMYHADGVAWREAQGLAAGEHAGFKVSDPWDDVIRAWLWRDSMDQEGEGLARGYGKIRTLDVLVSALGMHAQQITKASQMRAARSLGHLGFTRHVMRIGGENVKVWVAGPGSGFDVGDLA